LSFLPDGFAEIFVGRVKLLQFVLGQAAEVKFIGRCFSLGQLKTGIEVAEGIPESCLAGSARGPAGNGFRRSGCPGQRPG
jgi:hypothetical protein